MIQNLTLMMHLTINLVQKKFQLQADLSEQKPELCNIRVICKHRVWEKISKHDVSFISRLCEDNSAVKVKQTSARFGLKKCYLFPVAMLQIEFWLMKSHFFIKTRFLTILCFKSGFIFFSIKSKLSFRANNEKSKCWKGLYSQNKWVF